MNKFRQKWNRRPRLSKARRLPSKPDDKLQWIESLAQPVHYCELAEQVQKGLGPIKLLPVKFISVGPRISH